MAFNSTIPSCKIGMCYICDDGIMKECRKVGKNMICLNHYRNEKNKIQLAKSIERNKVRSLIKTDTNLETKGSMELNRWFDDRIKELTGICKNCGGKTKDYSYRVVTENLEVYVDRKNYDRHYVAHILPKAYFPSVATHPDNWIELCFHGNSCHTQMDNKMLDLIDMNCFDEIVTKFVKMYPSIATIEKRRIPSVLMQYIEVEK